MTRIKKVELMKPKLFRKIAEDMKSGIPIKMEISYGAIEIDPDFLKLLNKEFGGKRGIFHTDENCSISRDIETEPCRCSSMDEPLIVKLNNRKAANSAELEKMADDLSYFSKKFRGIFWQSYVYIKDKNDKELCSWNIGSSSSYEKLKRHEVESFFEEPNCAWRTEYSLHQTESALKTAIRNCPSHGKTCKYLRRISGALK